MLVSCSLFGGQSADNATRLAVGECFDQPAKTTDTKDVQARPCDEPHDAEVILKTSHPAEPGAPYPTTEELRAFMRTTCVPGYASYTGSEFVSASGMDFGLFYPLESAWTSGDREVSCYVSLVDHSKLNASVKTAGSTAAPSQ